MVEILNNAIEQHYVLQHLTLYSTPPPHDYSRHSDVLLVKQHPWKKHPLFFQSLNSHPLQVARVITSTKLALTYST